MKKLLLISATLLLLGAGCTKGSPTGNQQTSARPAQQEDDRTRGPAKPPMGPAPTTVSTADCERLFSANQASTQFGVPMKQTRLYQDSTTNCTISFEDTQSPKSGHQLDVSLYPLDAVSAKDFKAFKTKFHNAIKDVGNYTFEIKPAGGIKDEALLISRKTIKQPGNTPTTDAGFDSDLLLSGRNGWYAVEIACYIGRSTDETLPTCDEATYLDLARTILPRVPR